MSPLTPYSPGPPILQPGGGAEAREVGKGSLMSTSKSSRASRGLVVSIVIFLLPLPTMASLALLLEHYMCLNQVIWSSLCVCQGHGKALHALR